MNVKLAKWGNSLAFRIPSHIAKKLNIEDGASVKLETQGNSLVITPQKAVKKYYLTELLSCVTSENMHLETDWGSSEGEEIL